MASPLRRRHVREGYLSLAAWLVGFRGPRWFEAPECAMWGRISLGVTFFYSCFGSGAVDRTGTPRACPSQPNGVHIA